MTVIERYVKSSTKPTITVTDVDLSFNETYQWIFSGLNVNIWQCNVNPISIVVQSERLPNHTEHVVENPEIVIQNSSFGSLDLNPGTKAQITDCYIDAQFKPRLTLITANNSDVLFQDCHFGNFINENGSTVLYGHDNSHIAIENSVFIQHSSSKGVLFLHNNSSMGISSSSISQNVASSPGYSSITLQDEIHAVVHNTVFRNNSALVGGAVIAQDECRVTLTNCTVSSNKAITGKTSHIFKNSNIRRATRTLDQNTIRLYTPISPTLFNQTSLGDKRRKVIAPRLLVKSSILKKISVQKEDGLLEPGPGQGGAIYVAIQSQLLVTNCTFEDNSAQSWGGAIITVFNVTLRVQETTFVGNKAQRGGGAILAALNATLHVEETRFVGKKILGQGGAIDIQHQAHLRITNCVFDDNISQKIGGAISAADNVTLDIKETNFTRNRVAEQGGAIVIQQQSYLRMTNCVFDDNISEWQGGAIIAVMNATLDIQETNFTRNRAALQGGAIDVEQQSYLRMTNCMLEDNTSQQDGGAIAATFNATLEIQETNFTRNRAAEQGGAIVIEQSYLRMTNCVFDNNITPGNGGAINAGLNATLDIQETNFTRNSAEQGGAIDGLEQSYLQMTNCAFDDNISGRIGGAIDAGYNATLDIQETNFARNRAAIQGGAIHVFEQVHLRITDCTFKDNHAAENGGAIVGGLQVVLEINGSYFSKNSANKGGAINVQEQVNLCLTNCRLERNFAGDIGGAILIWANAILRIREINFTGNSARDGGALNVGTLTDCHVVQSVFNLNAVKRSGGAVYMESKASLQVENTNFTNNNASDGGAIHIQENSKLQTNMSNFWKNLAKRAGGAIVLKGYSSAVIESCHFLSNYAVDGGAVHVNNPEHVIVHSTSFLRNVASHTGGAISISSGTDVIINDIICVDNQGLNGGGCLFIDSVTLTLNNSDISENCANEFGAGVSTSHSRIQVSTRLTNGTRYFTSTVNITNMAAFFTRCCPFSVQ